MVTSREITMNTRASIPRIALAALPLAAGLAWAPAQSATRVAGTFSSTIANQHASPVADAPMHAVTLTEWYGTNRSTGEAEYMSGGRVTNVETSDLAQGSGPHQGYITFVSGTDTTTSKWSGKVTTVLGPDKQPATTFEGTWTMATGTGRYRGATGHGTYKGRMLSARESTVNWQGELTGIKVPAK
jgi:hypothetical protein